MPKLIKIPTFSDHRGDLSVIESLADFDIKRIYYIYNLNDEERGGHRHKKTKQLLIAVNGSCDIYCQDKTLEYFYKLDSPRQCLFLNPEDWHKMSNFSNDCVLLLIASEEYSEDDYINEKWTK